MKERDLRDAAGLGEAGTSGPVLHELRSGVLILTLNRPEKLNAWTAEMENLYYDRLEMAEADPRVRVVVVTGAGRGFCAGADLGGTAQPIEDPQSHLPVRRWDAYPPTMLKPVIAAINGPCAGIGLVIALQCDVRFVAADAKLTMAFTRRGLIAEHGSSWLLPRLVGRGRALDLLLSSRVFLGEEAGRIGIAEFVVPASEVLEAALAYASDLATNCSPTALAAVKVQIERHLTLDPKTAITESDSIMARSFTWPDMVEGITAWQEKRPPRFHSVNAPEIAREMDSWAAKTNGS